MAGKQTRAILVCVVLVYTFLMMLLMNRILLKIYMANEHRKDSDEGIVLKFDVRLSKEGIEKTSFENQNTNTKVDFIKQRAQSSQRSGGAMKSEEIIFIDKREYQDGRIELDQTKIKHHLAEPENFEVNTQQKTFNSSESNTGAASENSKEKKYLFALRYYEQLAMVTKNFLSLASLATATGRSVVEPFVNNSRFSGLPTGFSYKRLREAASKYSKIDNYFNREELEHQMLNRGYNALASFDEFKENCDRLDVVVHFLYNDANTNRDLVRWYKLTADVIKEVRTQASRTGWVECDFVKRSRIDQFLGVTKVAKYVCVDPEIITTPAELQRFVLKDAKCSAIISWKGNGTKRTHFDVAERIMKPMQPFEIQHARNLIEIAYDYIRNRIERPFISVHVRIERHFKWEGMLPALNCIRKLTVAIQKHKRQFKLKKIFLAHDLGVHGSDTLQRNADKQSLTSLEKELMTSLANPYRFNPEQYGLYDRGAIAIVEMHIMSLGESLFTLGKGNFQEWIVNIFLLQNAEDTSLIHKVCEMPQKKVM